MQSLSQDFLRKSLRTHAARFPEARQYVSGMEGAGLPERVLESLAKRSPPIRRLAELHKLLTRLLAVSPQDRPSEQANSPTDATLTRYTFYPGPPRGGGGGGYSFSRNSAKI